MSKKEEEKRDKEEEGKRSRTRRKKEGLRLLRISILAPELNGVDPVDKVRRDVPVNKTNKQTKPVRREQQHRRRIEGGLRYLLAESFLRPFVSSEVTSSERSFFLEGLDLRSFFVTLRLVVLLLLANAALLPPLAAKSLPKLLEREPYFILEDMMS